ncbi:Hsp70 family protein [Cochlodiniinecator piscidefendens]|uniref:Hsp70 family protein n=1 Tax=Cochlodiniinecator piscidefendens TaxID=2715756 RepID=UPI00140B76ED|nr:Hsp70 family protein [Cochlodiniinecator piscidefendens]
MQTKTLAIDFGTSNSAAAVLREDGLYRIPIEGDEETLPTAVFFPTDESTMLIGTAASAALIDGEEGRYMRSLKSVLGHPLAREERLVGGRRRTLIDIITAFLREVRLRAEKKSGDHFKHALSGRPVRFHSADAQMNVQAEIDLRECYLAAGFESVSFLAEPEAAALASYTLSPKHETGIIVDIGGGTSDFTVFKTTEHGPNILASYGIRLGGTDFDRSVALTHSMPMLGLGGELRREMGSGLLPVPVAPFRDLATWAKIPFLYNAETRRSIKQMQQVAVEPQKFARFANVLEEELGHDLAFAVERGKIAANTNEAGGKIDMGIVEKGLNVPINERSMTAALAHDETTLSAALVETLKLAGLNADQIQSVILVGGSSLMSLVAGTASTQCPRAELRRANAFTAVVDGLAIAAAKNDAMVA